MRSCCHKTMSQARIELKLLGTPHQHDAISATATVTGLTENLVPSLKHWQQRRWHQVTQRHLFHSRELKVQISQYACVTTQPVPVRSSCHMFHPTYFRHKRHKSKSIWIKRHATSQPCPLMPLVDNATLACHRTIHRYESGPEWLHS